MTMPTYNLDRDLAEAKAIAENLIPYVYQDQLYGSIGGLFGSSRMPSVTVGALLLRLHRLHALESRMSDAQKATLTEIEALNEQARREWTVHYHEKLLSEAKSRLNVIEAFFADCEDNPRSCAANYPPEAMRRTIAQIILEALAQEHSADAELDRSVRKVDARLRRITAPADFILAAELEAAFPKETYWWLYVTPPRAVQQD